MENITCYKGNIRKIFYLSTLFGNNGNQLKSILCYEVEIVKPKILESKESIEEINVSVFKDIHIHFPGDVYILAVWIAMSDRAKSTPTSQPHTTLMGLASKFSSAYGTDYSNPLDSDDVMDIFRRHGINGNPWQRLEDEDVFGVYD